MISVNDLMLGDWVKIKPNLYMSDYDLKKTDYDPKTHPYLIVKVEQLSDYGINPIERWGDISWTVETEIDGIELTPEIFKANGFTELSTGEFYIVTAEHNYMYWSNGELYMATSDGEFEFGQDIYIKDCKYVHELQHELKSLKLIKEIKYESLVS